MEENILNYSATVMFRGTPCTSVRCCLIFGTHKPLVNEDDCLTQDMILH